MWAELVFKVGAEHSGLDPGGARNLVDFQDLVELAERDDDRLALPEMLAQFEREADLEDE